MANHPIRPLPTPTPIAVIGMSGRYPGGANSTGELWQNLLSGKDGISPAKGDRWDPCFHNAKTDANNRFYAFEAGFLDEIDRFDADFFGISPREARQVDPQQRLLLELAWEALEDANVPPRQLSGSRTGVFIGLSNHDYAELTGPQSPDAYTNTGMSMAIASNRISYVLNLKGPSLTVDTACSSGMVSVHMACQSLAQGESDVALAGACNMLIGALPWLGFAQASMLSPESRCKSFDATGAGYVRSEGGGMLVLKTLADAERDGDHILGVILATGVNSDGKTMGLSMPDAQAQATLLREVYGKAQVRPEEVFYVEAHGTGTAVGDPIECRAIGEVLGERPADQPLHIGSIKSNIGHLEPAAGIAGLTKVLLALRHRTIPANLHFVTPNPKIDFEGWKLKVVAEHLPLPDSEQPLTFGINSFGFGGTNAHAVLREYRPAAAPATAAVAVPADDASAEMSRVLLLSAQQPSALPTLAAAWAERIESEPELPLSALRSAAVHFRQTHAHRLAVKATDRAETVAQLRAFMAGTPGLWETSRTAAAGQPRLAWVFSGNGPQWQGMGCQLLALSPVFRRRVDEVDACFKPMAGWSIVDALRAGEAESRMPLTEVAQPCLFALQLGLLAVLQDAGLQAELVFGHSVGEVAAAYASGALSLAQATQVIHRRSEAQSHTAGMGKMAALALSADEAAKAIAEVLAGSEGFLELAAVNAPRAVTVAGDPALLTRLCDKVTEMGRFARTLALDYAFHTSAMDKIRPGLAAALQGLSPGATHTRYLSTVEGEVIDGERLDADYWWRNVRAPVRFADAVNGALEAGITHFIEIGPHPVLKDYLLQCAKARSVTVSAVGSLRRPTAQSPADDQAAIWSLVLQAHAQDLVRPGADLPVPSRRLVLPSYPWQRGSHWRGWNHLPDVVAPFLREHPLLGWRAGALQNHWESVIDPDHQSWLKDHQVQDAPVFPAAGYIEIALAAARRHLGSDSAHDIEDLQVLKPLVLQEVQAVLTNLDASDGSFDIASRGALPSIYHPGVTTLHVRGRLSRVASPAPEPLDLGALRQTHPVDVDVASHYAECQRRGLNYGPAFQGIQSICLSDPDAAPSLLAEIVAPAEVARAMQEQAQPRAQLGDNALVAEAVAVRMPWRAHPALLDACLQSVIAMLARLVPEPLAFIPIQVDRVRSFGPLPERLFCHASLRSNLLRSGLADLTLVDEHGQVLLQLTGARFQKVEFHDPTRSMPRLVEHWRPAGTLGGPLPLPDDLLARSLPAAAAPTLPTAPDSARQLHDLSASHARQALAQIAPGAAAVDDPDRLQRRLRLPDEALPGLRLALQAARALDVDPATAPLLDDQWRSAWLAHGEWHREWMWLSAWLDGFASRLRGELPALDAEPLLDGAPWIAPAQDAVLALLAGLAQAWPGHRPVRVLELAGRSGAMTARSLQALRPLSVDYLFTDPQGARTDSIAQRLSGQRALRVGILDLVQNEATAGSADLVLCHSPLATPLADDLALRRAHDALVPGGLLVFTVALPHPFAQLLGEPGTALARWTERALAAGFVAVQPLTHDLSQPVVALVARRGSADMTVPVDAALPEPAASQRWLLVSDEADRPLADALALALQRQAQQAQVVLAGPALSAEALGQGELQVVHLAGSTPAAHHAEAQLAHSHHRCEVLLTLSHLLEAQAEVLQARLSLVTRGAFATPTGQGPIDPSQIAVWGMARVLSNEHSRLRPKLVDLHLDLNDPVAVDALAAELLRSGDESEVLLCREGRYINRVEPATEADYRPLPAAQVSGFRLVAPAHGGGLDALRLARMALPAPGPGEVRIAVRAAGLNYRDVLWAMGLLPEEAVEHGFAGATVGMECAGRIEAVGAGVDDLAVGDRVMAFASDCFASHVNTARKAVVRLPDSLSDEQAATVPTTFLTAHYALNHLAHLEAGESVLIHGAAGGVGLAAVQIALQAGATVFGTAGSEDKRRLLRRLGVQHVLDSRSLAFVDQVMALTGGAGVDVVLNSLAGEAITKNLQLLKPFGRMLEIGKRDLYGNSRIGLRPFRNNLSYFGIDADTLLIERPALAVRMFQELMRGFESGQLHPLPYQSFPLTRAVQAFRRMQQSRHVGKLVLSIPSVEEVAPQLFDPQLQLNPEASYLVTGGLGGFGLASARWMVERGARHLVLLSRRGAVTEEAQAGVAAMEALGAHVLALAVDVTDAEALAGVLERIRREGPPLRGVLHAAMVLDDAPIGKLSSERILQVMRPKILGAWHLHELTRGDALDHFVVYSSGTTTMGNPGQANYVAANMALESLVMLRHSQGLPALSVGWGGILDVGVLTRSGDVLAQLQARAGISSVRSEAALAELGQLMALGVTRTCTAPFNVQRMAQLMPLARTPRFLPLAPEGLAEGLGQATVTLADRLAELPPEAHRGTVIEMLCQHLGRILGTGAAQVDPTKPLSDMGLDSLMAVELADGLEREVGRPVSVMQLLQAGNTQAIADVLLGMVQQAPRDAPRAPAGSGT